MAETKAKAPVSEKREYNTPESAAKQKAQWAEKGYKVTRKGSALYLNKGNGSGSLPLRENAPLLV